MQTSVDLEKCIKNNMGRLILAVYISIVHSVVQTAEPGFHFSTSHVLLLGFRVMCRSLHEAILIYMYRNNR